MLQNHINTERTNYEGMHLLRAMACCFVVLSHATMPPSLMTELNTVWQADVFFRAIIRVSVPLFIMISGYLLLDREEPIFLFYKKRARRIIPPFLFYFLLYYTAISLFFNKPIGIDTLISFFDDGGTGHMWYLFTLIGIYSFMPFTRLIFKNSTSHEKIVFIIFWFFVTSFAPTLDNYFESSYDFTVKFGMYQFFGYFGYTFLGACGKLIHVGPRERKIWLSIWFICTILVMLITYIASYSHGAPYSVFIERMSPFVVLATISAFFALKDIRLGKYLPIIMEVSKHSFGIYLIHVLVLTVLKRAYINGQYGLSWVTHPLAGALALLISFFIIKHCKKIPYVRRIIG